MSLPRGSIVTLNTPAESGPSHPERRFGSDAALAPEQATVPRVEEHLEHPALVAQDLPARDLPVACSVTAASSSSGRLPDAFRSGLRRRGRPPNAVPVYTRAHQNSER